MIAHKVRLNPTDGQARMFEEWAESARRAWNWALSEWERQYRDRVGANDSRRTAGREWCRLGNPGAPTPTRRTPRPRACRGS